MRLVLASFLIVLSNGGIGLASESPFVSEPLKQAYLDIYGIDWKPPGAADEADNNALVLRYREAHEEVAKLEQALADQVDADVAGLETQLHEARAKLDYTLLTMELLLDELFGGPFGVEAGDEGLQQWQRRIADWAEKSFDQRGITSGHGPVGAIRKGLDIAVRQAVASADVRSGSAFWQHIATAEFVVRTGQDAEDIGADDPNLTRFQRQFLTGLILEVLGPPAIGDTDADSSVVGAEEAAAPTSAQ